MTTRKSPRNPTLARSYLYVGSDAELENLDDRDFEEEPFRRRRRRRTTTPRGTRGGAARRGRANVGGAATSRSPLAARRGRANAKNGSRVRSPSRGRSPDRPRSPIRTTRSPSPARRIPSPLSLARRREKEAATPSPAREFQDVGRFSDSSDEGFEPFLPEWEAFHEPIGANASSTSRSDALRTSPPRRARSPTPVRPSSPGDSSGGSPGGRSGRGRRGRGGRGGGQPGGGFPGGTGPVTGIEDAEVARIRSWLAADPERCRELVSRRTREERALGLLPYVRSEGLVEALASSRSKMVCDRVSPRLTAQLATRFRNDPGVNSVTGRPIRRGAFTWKVLRVASQDRFPGT